MYCERCNSIFEGKRCPVCGSKRVREPIAEDLCLVTEKESLWSGTLEDVFKQNNIPYITKSVLGAGITSSIGIMHERIRFYVPYEFYESASDLVEELFAPADEEDIPEEE